MRIFFSHSSGQKPLIREIRKILPDHINTWIDEDKLLIGDSIEHSLENAIKKETDYILLFIDSFSVNSRWVEKEISWTLEQERKLDRVFLLPIVVDVQAWNNIKPEIIKERKYLKLEDYTENSVRALAKRITSELFSLICRDIQALRSPGNVTKASVIAGSTTDELAKILCTRLENKSLFNITIVTTSISAANIFLETGTRLGFDDENSGFKLYLSGGRVRPNTLAVIEEQTEESPHLQNIFDQLGGVDFSIIGVNGIHFENGFTTHSNAETKNKLCLMKNGRKKLILGDVSKIGIVEEVCFGTFQDDVILVTNDGGDDPRYIELIGKAKDKVHVAK